MATTSPLTSPLTRLTRRLVTAIATVLVGLSLTALTPAGAATASPLHMQRYPSGDFGYVLIGQKVVKKFTVRNTGHRRTGPLRTSLTGTDSLRVPASKDHCDGRNLRPGDTCRVTVRYTPEMHYDATLNRFVSGAKGRLAVTSERRASWTAIKRLSGVGDTQATQLARPVCTGAGGTLQLALVQDLWQCVDWSYADEAEYDGRRGVLETVCHLGGALTLSTPAYSDLVTTTSSLCTSAGG